MSSSSSPSKSRWRRVFKWTLRLALVLFGCLIVAGWFVHSSIGEERLRSLVVRQVESALGGSANLDRLELHLLDRSVTIDGLEIAADPERFPLRLRLAHASARLRHGGLVASLEAPDLSLGPFEPRGKTLETTIAGWLRLLRLRDGVIENGRLRILTHGGPLLDLEGLSGHVAGVSSFDVDAETERATLAVGGRQLVASAARLSGRLDDLGVHLTAARVESGVSWVEAEGELSPVTAAQGELATRFTGDASLARIWVPDLPLEATASGAGEIHVDGADTAVELRATSHDLVYQELGPADAETEVRVDRRGLAFSGRARAYGGSAVTQGAMEFGGDLPLRLDVSLEGLDPAPLLGDLGADKLLLATRISGELSLQISRQGLGGRGRFALAPAHGQGVPVQGRVELDLDQSGLLVNARRVALPGLSAVVAGRLDGGQLRATVDARIDDLGELGASLVRGGLLERLPEVLERPTEGTIAVRGKVAGPLQSPTFEGTVSSGELVVAERPLAVSTNLSANRERLDFRRLELRTLDEQLDLLAEGTVDLQRRTLDARVHSAHAELAALVPADSGLDLKGRATLSGQVSGSIEAPRGAFEVQLSELRWRDASLPDLQLEIESDGKATSARSTMDGRQLAVAQVELSSPYPMEAELDLGAVPWDPLRRAIRPPEMVDIPDLHGIARAHLDLENPRASLTYRIDVEELLAGPERRTTIDPFSIVGDASAVELAALRLHRGESVATLSGRVPFTMTGPLALQAQSTGHLGLVESLVPGLTLEGSMRIDVSVSGTLDEPVVKGNAAIQSSKGEWGALDWKDLDVVLAMARDHVHIERARARVLDGQIELGGDLPVGRHPGSSRWRLEMRANALDLAHLIPPDLQTDLQESEVEAKVSIGGFIESAALSFDDLRGEGWIRADELGGVRRHMETVENATWIIDANRAELRDLHLRGERGELTLDATASFATLPPDFELGIVGDFDLSLLELITGPTMQIALSGPASIDLQASQEEGVRSWSGRVSAHDGRVHLQSPRAAISDLELALGFSGETVEIETLRGRTGSGELTLDGIATLPGLAALGAVDLRARLREVPVEVVEGVRTVVSGEARLHGDGQYRLEGDIGVAHGLFDRGIDAVDAEKDFLAQVRRSLLEAEGETMGDRIALDLHLRTIDDFTIANELAQLGVAGTLDIQGTLANPSVFGTLTAQPQGTLILGRNRFDVERATVRLDDVPSQPIEIDLEAWTEVSGASIVVDVRGPLDAIETELRSPEPELTQADLASMLLTGRRMDAASEGVREIAAAQAATYMSDALSSQIGIDLGLVFGTLSDFPFLSTEVDPASQFTVGKQVTDKLSVAFSRSLDDTERDLWIVDYQPLPRFWLRAIQSQGSAYTFEVAHRRQFEYRKRPTFGGGGKGPTSERVEKMTILGDVPEGLDLEGSLALKTGRRYDFWQVRDQATTLRHRLVVAGYRSAWVEATTEKVGTDAIAVRYQVDAGPLTVLEWSGDDPGSALWKEIERRWDGRILEEFLVDNLSRFARTDLQRRGLYGASVTVATESTAEGHRVVFDFQLGPKGKGVDVRFSGNQTASEEELLAALPPRNSRTFFSLIGGRRRDLRDVLALRYAEMGHLDIDVLDVQTAFAGEGQPLQVEITLSEGPLFEIGEIRFEGATSIPTEELLEVIGLVPGQPFVVSRYLKTRGDLVRHYRAEGFWGTGVRVRTRRNGNAMDLVYVVEEGLRARVGSIEITGMVATHEQLVRRRLTFSEGEPLAAPQLLESQRRLYELGLFRVVDIYSVATEDPSVRNVEVAVREMPDLQLDIGIRYRDAGAENLQPGIGSVSSGIEPALRAKFFQPFGGGGNVLLSLFPRFDGVIARVSHQRNIFAGLRLPTELYVEAQREHVEEVDQEVEHLGLTFQQYQPLSRKLRLQWSYQYRRSRLLADEAGPFQGLNTDWIARARISTSLVLDRRDNPILPQRGYFANLTLQIADGALGSDIDYVRLYGQLSLLVPFGSEEHPVVWATGVRLGATYVDQVFPFLDDRFMAGGPYSVRGFKTRGLGPVYPTTGLAVGGEAMAVFNQELRFPIWHELRGGVFFDAGNVFATREDFDLGDLRTSAGLGLRLELPFGVIRGDYGWILDRREGEPAGRFHVAFGHAF